MHVIVGTIVALVCVTGALAQSALRELSDLIQIASVNNPTQR